MTPNESKYSKNLYVGYSWFFKAFLILGIAGIVAIFAFFNQTVVNNVRQDATRISKAYAQLIQYGASEATDPAVIDFIFNNIITKVNFPIIVTDKNGIPAAWTMEFNPADTTIKTREKLDKFITQFDSHNPPIEIKSDTSVISILHYGDSALIGKLRLIPIIEMSVIVFFVLAAFLGFRNIKQSEQRSIWVGMAKETAHQLGTPLSSLIGWVELLKLKSQEGKLKISDDLFNGDFDEIASRMLGDLHRLELIATRFGQIGSAPELSPHDVNEIVRDAVGYLRIRLPGGGITINEIYGPLPEIKVNPELLRWVIENLVKNSMEAANPKTGVINISTVFLEQQKKVIITVEDNGRGIPAGEQSKIFSPGFTTKKRGWGLGLSLARRIVKEYHGGRIALKMSDPGIKTVFIIELPA